MSKSRESVEFQINLPADPVEAAAYRLRQHRAGTDSDIVYPHLSSGFGPMNDERILANAYLAHLVEQKAEAEERAKPVTCEWLIEIGFQLVREPVIYVIHGKFNVVRILYESGAVKIGNNLVIGWTVGNIGTTTRGMMLDFLDSLLIPHT